MNTMRLATLVWCCLLFAACGESHRITTPAPTPNPDTIVRENVALTRSAADAFAAENHGLYPFDVDQDTSLVGRTLIDLLPGGERLPNPYTGERSEPRTGLTTEPGGVGYQLSPINGSPTAFEINGYGAESELLRVDNNEEILESIRSNVETVRAALEAYAADHWGIYPSATSSLTEYFPGQELLVNVTTGYATEPVGGVAAVPGQIGYYPIADGGVNLGYQITAFGRSEMLVEERVFEEDEARLWVSINCYLTMDIVDAFARDNGGEYPLDLRTDRNTKGQTCLDLISGSAFQNPYTGGLTEPRDLFSTSPGSTNYEVVLSDGVAVGYRITGYGESGPIRELVR